MIDKELLLSGAEKFGVSLDDTALERFEIYANLLIESNKHVNLTAITDERGIVIKHFIDSLSVFGAHTIINKAKIIDVGTGAGFPGVAMLIARPDILLSVLDATKKKLSFIEQVLRECSLNADILHSRAEKLAHEKMYREKFDVVTARAVSDLPQLSEFCLPFAKKGGVFIAMKGAKAPDELERAKTAISRLGGKIEGQTPVDIGDEGQRFIISIKKISPTPDKYPRIFSQILKNPIE